ncbi:MAG: hypothetical protein OEM97_01010 [Acidimicrobiia bacterium]|nr:hypothetical protein [Acidimicrobiia bacterium]
MPTASFYRSVAADLEGLAFELDSCASHVLDPARDQLPASLDGGATEFLQGEYASAADDLRASAGTLRGAASWARGEAARIEVAEAAAAAAAASASDGGELADSAPPLIYF